MKFVISVVIIALFTIQNIFCDTIVVPNDQQTIQAAIDSSSNGDTVLVSPGTYLENINFNGKSIVLGSLFLTTGDTSYISQTIIDGNKQGCVVVFENGEDSTTVLSGFTITNGVEETYGGGIQVSDSELRIENCVITGNRSRYGGGISLHNSDVEITNSIIERNITQKNGMGGGIYADSSDVYIIGSTISCNEALHISTVGPMCQGGGFYAEDSRVLIEDCEIANNLSETDGGGISIREAELKIFRTLIENNHAGKHLFRTFGGGINVVHHDKTKLLYLEDVIIQNNYAYKSGGGIVYYPFEPIEPFKNVTIRNNSSSERGGGLSTNANLLITDSSNCSIYLNRAKIEGADIYISMYEPQSIDIYLDTTTVSLPNDYHIYPLEHVNLNFNEVIYNSTNSDLFVSPDGSNSNTGTSRNNPLKTIEFALKVAYADSSQQRTIFLDSGVYSNLTSGEQFPIYGRNYVSICGDSVTNTILDGRGKTRILEYNELKNSTFENFTIQNGYAFEGKNIYEEQIGSGGGVKGFGDAEEVRFMNLAIRDNRADHTGGGLSLGGNVELNRVVISDNIVETSSDFGGGAGISFRGYNPVKVLNCTISNNIILSGTAKNGGMSIGVEDAVIANSIVWNNQPQNIAVFSRFLFDSLATLHISNSLIEGGEKGIVTFDSMKVNWLEGNIDEDPQFVGGVPFDYNLTNTSPCINAGTPFLVWEGDTLINLSPDEYIGEAPDMGTLESDVLISVEENEIFPSKFELYQNYPNPFNPTTTISYEIAAQARNDITHVELRIYDVLGREVAELVDRDQRYGSYEVQYDASGLGSGVYFYQIRAGSFVQSKKMVILK